MDKSCLEDEVRNQLPNAVDIWLDFINNNCNSIIVATNGLNKLQLSKLQSSWCDNILLRKLESQHTYDVKEYVIHDENELAKYMVEFKYGIF